MVHLLVLLPFALSAAWPALTPAGAVIAAWLVALGAGARLRGRALLVAGAAAWALLHQLRADAPWPAGVALLAVAVVTLAWARGTRARRAAPWIAALLTVPALLVFLLALDQRRAPAPLRWADAWHWAAAPTPAPRTVRVEDARLDAPWTGQVPVPPEPRPLEPDSGQRLRALLLVAWALAAGAAGALPGRKSWRWSLLAVPAAAAGPLLGGPRPLTVHVQRPAAWVVLQVRAGGAVETRVSAEGPPTAAPVAWLERRRLAVPESGGEEAGLAVLRRWAAVDAGEEARRWEAAPDGRLVRRLLP